MPGCAHAKSFAQGGQFSGRGYASYLAEMNPNKIDQARADERKPLLGMIEKLA